MNGDPSELDELRTKIEKYDEIWASALPRLRALKYLERLARDAGLTLEALVTSPPPSPTRAGLDDETSTLESRRNHLEADVASLLHQRKKLQEELEAADVERQSAFAQVAGILSDLDLIRKDTRKLLVERAELMREVAGLRTELERLRTAVDEQADSAGRPHRDVDLDDDLELDLDAETVLELDTPDTGELVSTPARARDTERLDEMLDAVADLPVTAEGPDAEQLDGLGPASAEEEDAFSRFFDAVDERSEKERRWMLKEEPSR